MKRILFGIVASSLAVLTPASTIASTLDSTIASAQQAIEQQQYKRAESALKKAVDQAESAGENGPELAQAEILLARASRELGKVNQAGDALERAHSIYKTLGYVEQPYVDELKNLSGSYKRIDTSSLGPAGDKLKSNSGDISMAKIGNFGHVELRLPAPLENSLNSTKIDGLQLEKLVTFDIEQPDSASVHISNIKGFRIHSVEKNTWVNLFDVVTGSQGSDGMTDATITAGKAGITKTVQSRLPASAVEPIAAMARQLSQFGTAVAIDLPLKNSNTNSATASSPPPTSTTSTTSPASTSTAAASSSSSDSSIPGTAQQPSFDDRLSQPQPTTAAESDRAAADRRAADERAELNRQAEMQAARARAEAAIRAAEAKNAEAKPPEQQQPDSQRLSRPAPRHTRSDDRDDDDDDHDRHKSRSKDHDDDDDDDDDPHNKKD